MAEVKLTPELSYGPTGFPPLIPPNAPLTYQIELLDFNNSEQFFEGKVIKTILEVGKEWIHVAYETKCKGNFSRVEKETKIFRVAFFFVFFSYFFFLLSFFVSVFRFSLL